MAKRSKRDSSSDDERELDDVVAGRDEGADDLDDDASNDEDVDLYEDDEVLADADADDGDADDGDLDDEDLDDEDLDDEDDADLDDDEDDAQVAAGATAATKGKPQKKTAAKTRDKRTKTAKPAKADSTSAIPGAAPGNFLQQVGSELQKVVWPTRKQMITYTSVVIVFVVILVTAVWGFDLGLGKLMEWIFA